MRTIAGPALVGLALMVGGPALAAPRTVTLAVDNLFCASCPYIVKRTLADVAGVSDVAVSFRDKKAVVTYDDQTTDAAALVAATGDMGFPSRVIE